MFLSPIYAKNDAGNGPHNANQDPSTAEPDTAMLFAPFGYTHPPLPLPGDLKYLWLDVQKIIDTLHMKNHSDPRCEQYNPAKVLPEDSDMNTMSCEQTFAWLSRYKKILCAMPKTHHHFYLHRMVQRRNSYISWCYSEGRRPVQPKVRHVN